MTLWGVTLWEACVTCIGIATALLVMGTAIEQLSGNKYVVVQKPGRGVVAGPGKGMRLNYDCDDPSMDDFEEDGNENTAPNSPCFVEGYDQGDGAEEYREQIAEGDKAGVMGRHWTMEAVHHSKGGTSLRYVQKSQRLGHGHRRDSSFVDDLGMHGIRSRLLSIVGVPTYSQSLNLDQSKKG